MLKFAGYVLAGAGSATGVWTATNAATDAVVGFATSALESAYSEEIRRRQQVELAREQGTAKATSYSGESFMHLAAECCNRDRHPFQTRRLTKPALVHEGHQRYQRMANAHRHQMKVEPLDLALGRLDEQPAAREVVTAVLNCAMIWTVSTILHGWLLILQPTNDAVTITRQPSRPYLRPIDEDQNDSDLSDISPTTTPSKHTGAVRHSTELDLSPCTTPCIPSPFLGLANELADISEKSQAAGNEINISCDATWLVRPSTPEAPQGMHNSDLHRVPSTGCTALRTSSSGELALSSTTIRRVRSRRIKPTLEDIRKCFMLTEEVEQQEPGNDDDWLQDPTWSQ